MNISCFCRRYIIILICSILCVATPMTAKGGNAEKWESEYKAYGRNINVSVTISVSDKEIMPFLAINPMQELSTDDMNKFKKIFDDLNQTDDSFTFVNKANRISIGYSDHKSHPDISDADKVTTPAWSLLAYDGDTAYAENNLLTVNEAEDIIQKNIQMIFSSVVFQPRDIIVNDRTKYRKTDKQITDKGYYEINSMQMIDEIPIAASIHQAYRFGQTKRDAVVGNYGSAHSWVTDQKNFEGNYILWNKTAELGIPNQLLSFDVIKPIIEELIMKGNVRNIYHAYLGYAQYDLPEGSKYEYVLAPAWVFWVDWVDTASEEIDRDAQNGNGLYTEWYYYKPIIINAVSGETTDPLNESESRMLLPAPCMKYVEDY